MSESEAGYPKIQYSFFLGDRSGPQLVVRVHSMPELARHMAELAEVDEAGESFASAILNATAGVQAAAKLVLPTETQHAGSAGGYRGHGGGNGVGEPSNGDTKPCPKCNGTLTYRAGIAKASGKPYKAWFCSSDIRDHNVFVN